MHEHCKRYHFIKCDECGEEPCFLPEDDAEFLGHDKFTNNEFCVDLDEEMLMALGITKKRDIKKYTGMIFKGDVARYKFGYYCDCGNLVYTWYEYKVDWGYIYSHEWAQREMEENPDMGVDEYAPEYRIIGNIYFLGDK